MIALCFSLQVDPVRDILNRFGLETEARDRHVLTVDSVTMDNMGLQKLLVGRTTVCLSRSFFFAMFFERFQTCLV